MKAPLHSSFDGGRLALTMARVTVVGAGVAGLAAALYATTAGHHVVVLDRTDRLGGKATSQQVDGVPFGFGLHLFDRRGPLASIIKKISRLKPVTSSPRLDRLEVVGIGPLRPRQAVRKAAALRSVLRNKDMNHPAVQSVAMVAGSGVDDLNDRYAGLLRGRLTVVGEGWSGLVGRMAAALDEVGVLIEPNCQVTAVERGQVSLADGRTFECDTVIVACGVRQARTLLSNTDDQILSSLVMHKASTIDVTLNSRPMGIRHGVFDPAQGAWMLDLANIQPRWGLDGAFLSAMTNERDNESSEDRMERLVTFMDQHAKGWQHHVVHQRQQQTIVVQTTGVKPSYDALAHHGILLAGEWVASDHRLADAAAATGRFAGMNVGKTLS